MHEARTDELEATGLGRAPRAARGAARWVVPLLVAGVTAAAFAPAVRNEFVNWDDYPNFVENPKYRGVGAENLRWMFTTFHMGPYQPLSWMSLGLDYVLWGESAAAYHAMNIVYHALAAVLVYLVAARLLSAATGVPREATATQIAAGVAAAVFGAHPLRVESVAWATERRDVLSGLLLAATVLLYLQAQERTGAARWRRLGASVGVYVLSLLAKGIGMSLPVVLLAIDAWPLRRFARRDDGGRPDAAGVVVEKLPFLVFAVVAGVAGLYGQSQQGALIPMEQQGLMHRVLVASYATWFYVVKTLWPAGLHPVYLASSEFPVGAWPFWAAVGGVAAVTGLAVWQWRRRSWIAAAWVCYGALLAPVSGLAQAGPQIAADRYAYLPGIVLGLVVGGGLLALRRRLTPGVWNGAVAAVAALVVIGAGRAAALTRQWRDSETLWRYTLACDPINTYALSNLGDGCAERGDFTAALEYYREAARIDPSIPEHHANVAWAYDKLGRLDEAIAAERRAVEITPRYPDFQVNLGSLLMAKGSAAEAVEPLRTALDLNPYAGKARLLLGQAMIALGQTEDGEWQMREALRIEPTNAELFLMASRTFARWGRLKDAVAVVRQGREQQPSNPELAQRLAWLLATARDDGARDGPEALQLAEWLVAQKGRTDPTVLATLAAAQGEMGMHAEARETIREALRLCPPDFPAGVRSRYELMEQMFASGYSYPDIE